MVAVAGVGVGIAIAAAVALLGPLAALAPLVIVAGVWLTLRPWWALFAFAAVTILCGEDATQALIGQEEWFHKALPGITLSPVNVLLLVLLASVIVDVTRSGRRFIAPGLLTFPLLALAALTVAGGLVGASNATHDSTQLLNQVRGLSILIVLPFAIVNLPPRKPAVRTVVVVTVGLAALTALQGLAAYAQGVGKSIDNVTITYISETPNWVTALMIFGALALVIGRGRLPFWVVAAAVLSFVSLTLSFRRAFWLGAVVGIVITIVAVRGGRRARLLPVGLAVAAVVLSLTTGIVGGAQGALALRFSQLSPTQVQSSQDDRYRLDETRNVWQEIQSKPVTGLGLGVPWRVRKPLSQTLPDGTFYNHLAVLWFWLHLGILGPVVYVWLLGVGLLEALRVGRRDRDAIVRAAGIAVAAGLVAVAVAETTATYVGADQRFDALFGLVLGWVAWARVSERAELDDPDPIAADPPGRVARPSALR